MKRIIFIQLIIVCSIISSVAQTNYYETTKTAVAEISAETKAFNDGKGVGLIIGTGGSAANDGNMGSAIVEQKDCPTNFVENNRKISLCEASFFYQALYNNHFIVAEQPEA